MGAKYLERLKSPMSISTFSIVIGCILVPGLEKFKTVLKNKDIESENLEIK